jgi:hypothetical protein
MSTIAGMNRRWMSSGTPSRRSNGKSTMNSREQAIKFATLLDNTIRTLGMLMLVTSDELLRMLKRLVLVATWKNRQMSNATRIHGA